MGPVTILDRHPISDPWLAASVSVPADRCGPPGMANGGWVAGTVAAHLGPGAVQVDLRAPTPLEKPLDLRAADDRATLSLDERVLVDAMRTPGAVRAPAPVDWPAGEAATAAFAGHHDHPFPGCFVCGTARAAGDGLRIFPGPVPGVEGLVAAVFTPHPAHAGPSGRLPGPAVWAALDCPTAWAHLASGEVPLLARLRAEVRGPVHAGRPYLVVAEVMGRDGRKAYGRAGIYDTVGHLLAASEALWIMRR